MSIPPEVSFHRYFQTRPRNPNAPAVYKGKQDLDSNTITPVAASFLKDVQEALNEALRNERQGIPEHVPHHPFHFDYIEASFPNALAFHYQGHAFIGVTMGLIDDLWGVSTDIGNSSAVAALLEVPATPERREAILNVTFQTQLVFIVSHEYTHHVHGHLSERDSGASFFNEIHEVGAGRLNDQAFEMDADSYAVYHVLAHLITGPRRKQALEILGHEHTPPDRQDELLVDSFVISVGAFLYWLAAVESTPAAISDRTHPIQAARMSWIMGSTIGWARQNKPALTGYMTTKRFQLLMVCVSQAIPQAGSDTRWTAQTEFLRSEAGRNYFKELEARVKKHVSVL